MNYEMPPEFEQAVQSIDQSKKPLLITGAAGTGKSVLIRQLIKHYDGNAVACAFTGLAASNLGSVTLHSLFRIVVTPKQHPMDQVDYRRLVSRQRRDQWFRVVVIDEISMVDPVLLDLIDGKLKSAFDRNLLFGGKKVVMVGDPFQLSPIGYQNYPPEVQQRLVNDYGTRPNFRSALCLHGVEFEEIQLSTNWRQAGNAEFYEALLNIRDPREHQRMEYGVTWINNNRPRNFQPHSPCLKIRCTNREVDGENQKALGELERTEGTSRFEVVGRDDDFIYRFLGGSTNLFRQPILNPQTITDANLTDKGRGRLPTPPTVELAFGARVVLTANQWNHGLVNGTLGVLHSIQMLDGTVYNREKLPDAPLDCDALDWVEFCSDDSEHSVRIAPYRWGRNRVEYDEQTQRFRLTQEGSYRQVPFRLGYATTVHKAQGMTLDCVDFFLPPQTWSNRRDLIYTALSRVRNINGLYLDRDLMVEDLV